MSDNTQGVIRYGDDYIEVGFSMKGALTGLAAGSTIGGKFGGPVGAAVLGTACGLAGLFLGPED